MRTMEYKTGFMKYFVCVCLIQWCGGGGGNDSVCFSGWLSRIGCGLTVYHTKPSTLVLVGLYKQPFLKAMDNPPEKLFDRPTVVVV